jgi:serine protease inhibitor
MKKIFFILSLTMLAIVNYGCEKEKSPQAGDMKPVVLTEKQKQVIAGSNAFGFEFFGKVNKLSGSDKNLMVSPLSVSMALGMTRNGAANETLEAMTSALGFVGMTDAEINESYKYIVETFAALDPKVKLQIANSIWYRDDFSVLPAFIETNKTYFNAEVAPLDFSSPTAVDIINGWVNEKTNELIPEILDAIPADAVMYLVNAVYFKGQWKYQFDKEKTVEKPFTLANASKVQVPAMIQHATYNYFKATDFEAVELPYNQGNYTMTVLLPNYNKSVNDVISQLTQANWNTWSQQFSETDIQLQLPRFKYEYKEENMKPILTALGMGVAFTDNADFARINPDADLSISRVLHNTFIETNEEGSEAAAVTVVEIIETTAGPDQPYYFTVDRPFVYFISEKSTGTILFIGTVMNPAL